MADTWIHYFFGPLPQQYCKYFYLISILFAALFVMFAGMAVWQAAADRKNRIVVVVYAMYAFQCLVLYFVNRLLNTMCVNSVRG